MQSIGRNLMLSDIIEHLLVRPIGDWIQLDDAFVCSIDFDLRRVDPGCVLVPSQASDPRIERLQVTIQRLDLADATAQSSGFLSLRTDRSSSRSLSPGC